VCVDLLTGKEEGSIRLLKGAPGRYLFDGNVIAMDGLTITTAGIGLVRIAPNACR